MYIHTFQSQPTVIVSLKLNTHTYTLREDKLNYTCVTTCGTTPDAGPHTVL